MNTKKLLLALSILTTVVYADGPVYIDANIGANTSWDDLGLNANVGYLFNRYFAVEGGFTYSPGYTYNTAGTTFNSNYYMFDGAAKGILPLSDMFSLYGKLGVAYNDYTSSWNGCPGCGTPTYYGSNFGVLFGAGAQFNLARHWSLNLEDYTVTGPNPNFLVFGGEYKF